MTKKPQRLGGGGLGALLGNQTTTPGPLSSQQRAASPMVKSELIQEIPLSEIEPNPEQPRRTFDEERLEELSKSIATLGIIQPITVRVMAPGKYQIISGERRWRASGLAGLDTIPAYIRTADDSERLIMALVENIQRDDLDAIEVALSYQRLMDEAQLTQEEISTQVGKKRSTVANSLRLLKLPDEIQLAIREQQLSAGHARALLTMDSAAAQKSLARKIIEQGLSVRQAEEMVKEPGKPKKEEKKEKPQEASEELSEAFVKLVEGMEKCFSGAVSIKRGPGGGAKLTIELKTDTDIQGAIETIEKLWRTV